MNMQNKEKSNIMEYERPALTADCVLFRFAPIPNDSRKRVLLQVRLVRRSNAPEEGKYALLGTFVPVEDRISDVLKRCVSFKGGYEDFYFQQFYTFDTPGRDERWRVISVAHIGIVSPDMTQTSEAPDAKWYVVDGNVLWNPDNCKDILLFDELAFDHAEILKQAVKYLEDNIFYTDLASYFLPEKFTIKELKNVLECVGRKIINNVKRDFGKWVEETGEFAGDSENKAAHRPSSLFRWKRHS